MIEQGGAQLNSRPRADCLGADCFLFDYDYDYELTMNLRFTRMMKMGEEAVREWRFVLIRGWTILSF